MFPLKRSLILLVGLFVLALTAGSALAQAPFVSIVGPANGTVISNPAAPLPVSVSFGNAPEGGTGLLVQAWDDSTNTMIGQSATNDVSQIPWNTSIDFAPPPTPGANGHLIAFMIDGGGNRIATSPSISVTYGGSQPPPTPTNPPPPPTPTNQPSNATITINSPGANQTVDPINGVVVSGSTTNAPQGSTVLVRLRNANGDTLGEQGIVPNPNGSWSLSVQKTIQVPTTSNGSIVAFLLLNGNFVAQTNVIPLNFSGQPPPQQPTVTITNPPSGSIINISQAVPVSGTSSNLPVPQVTVRATRTDGSVIDQVTANTNGNGSWSANLGVNVPVGTQGTIYAFARDGQGSVVAQNSINVTWGQSTAAPVVTITSPVSGSVVGVNGSAIPVFGFAANVFENTVAVRAQDTFGNVLGQQSVTTDPQGNWQVNLFANTTPGMPGQLFAYATSPQNGSIVASSRVNVSFGAQCFIRTDWPVYVVQPGDTLAKIASRTGSTVSQLAIGNCLPNANLVFAGQQLHVPILPAPTPAPQQVTIRITSPVANQQLDISHPVTITGAGLNLGGKSVTVRALDTRGNVLAQQTLSITNAPPNTDSQWLANLNIGAPSGTQGSIYAYVQSPSTGGALLASTQVSVVFVSGGNVVPVPPPPTGQQLIITQPTANAIVTPSGALQVTGQTFAPLQGDVFVRVLDNQGNVIAEVQATVTPTDNQGNANWQAFLNINVPVGTRGTIFAYVPTPFDVAPLISAAVSVIFGQPNNSDPYVTITNPIPYATLDINNAVVVSGRGGRLFEGTVVVRAMNSQGSVLVEQATTINSPNAGTGGEGDWQISLPINVAEGTRGSLVAFSTSAQDGSIVAFASVPVTFGDPTTTANFVKINTPLPGTIADPSQTFMIAGTADSHNADVVKVQILDDQGHVLVEQPRNLSPASTGDFGVWQMLIELRSIAPGTHLRINALTASRFDGTTLATDSVDFIVGAASQGQTQGQGGG